MVFDIIFIIVFCWAAFRGFTKGFIVQIASLAALIIGILGAIKFSSFLCEILKARFNWHTEYLPIFSFAIIFIAIVVLVHILAKLLEKLADLTALSFINQLLGAIFSMIKYALIISVFLVLLNSLNSKTKFLPEKQIKSSVLYAPISILAPLFYPYLRYNFFPHQPKPAPIENEIAV
jgi:membrane protein required for colicin V production